MQVGEPDAQVAQTASVKLAAGVPFISDADLESSLEEAGVSGDTAKAIEKENATARLRSLRAALSVIALVAALALFFAGGIPKRQPGSV